MSRLAEATQNRMRAAARMPRVHLALAIGFAATLTGGNALAEAPIPPATTEFVMSVAQSDEYQILAGWDALAQSDNAQIRTFAKQMIDDHNRSIVSLNEATKRSGLAPPRLSMSSDQASLLSALQSQSGETFDIAYARQQVLVHHQALAVAHSYATAGTDAHLRKFAQTAEPLIQHSLVIADKNRSSLGGP